MNVFIVTGEKKDVWTIHEMEKLLHFLSKVFLLNFPLYCAHKQSLQSKVEGLTQQEAAALNNFCDMHDLEIPLHLLRNVCLFCRLDILLTYCYCNVQLYFIAFWLAAKRKLLCTQGKILLGFFLFLIIC